MVASPSSQRVVEAARAAGLQIEVREFPEGTRTAEDAARAIGAVPPLGHAHPLSIYCDRDLLAFDIVWAAAGTPRAVFSAQPLALVKACRATVADLKEEA